METRVVPLILLLMSATPLQAANPYGVANGPHNLSTSGTGTIKATSEQQICIFCHAPHNVTSSQPLWNRGSLPTAYKPYASKSLNAKPGQPTGSSKLCLSCHDGTIALGNIVSRNQAIPMAGGMTTIPAGRASNLGTDLSDDHPISFVYDAALATKNTALKSPLSLPATIKLDPDGELQCKSCHDPHDNTYGKFLVMANNTSQLCNTCHQNSTTTVPDHVLCGNCHKTHTAPSGPQLLKVATISNTCLSCHSGATTPPPQGPNVSVDLKKLYYHDTNPAIDSLVIPTSTNCVVCHDPHSMKTGGVASAPAVRPNAGKVPGVSAAGTALTTAVNEYEICFRCHGDQSAIAPRISRVIVQPNIRLKVFASSAVSFHPIEAAGKSTSVPGLKPGYTAASIIYCTDCHESDSSKTSGGTGANGPHGSNVTGVLLAAYNTVDNTAESAAAYALCYRCHDRTTLLSSSSGFSRHSQHVASLRTPCSTCHDPHGVAAPGTTTQNAHLMNFNTSVVTKTGTRTVPEYDSTGVKHGSCYLSCHGESHSPQTY